MLLVEFQFNKTSYKGLLILIVFVVSIYRQNISNPVIIHFFLQNKKYFLQ